MQSYSSVSLFFPLHAELARRGPANEPDKSKTSNSFWMFEEPWILEKLEFKLRQQLFNIKLP